ncbi:MAG: hypothetical protein JSR46_07945 [Verrucomicrobia bacterium]|nr:hypothetical protein [Verrucomicrobiota bacterium]
MCCPCCREERINLDSFVDDDEPFGEYEHQGTLCGRDVYCRLPTLRAQYVYAALRISSAISGGAAAVLWAGGISPVVGQVLAVCAVVPYVAEAVHMVRENMRFVSHREII